jgi:hypothetical protein
MPELENTAGESNAIDWEFDPMPPTTAERGYSAAWERASAKAIARWVEEHGWVCPGFMCEAHPSRDLTGHHVHAIADGGDEVPSPAGIRVLCRGCNVREAHYLKRCPAGVVCNRAPTGSPTAARALSNDDAPSA